MNFKKWLQMENLSGPGGGPDMKPIDVEDINLNISQNGAGAFNKCGNNPPKTAKTPTKNYEDKRFMKKK